MGTVPSGYCPINGSGFGGDSPFETKYNAGQGKFTRPCFYIDEKKNKVDEFKKQMKKKPVCCKIILRFFVDYFHLY